MEFKKYKIKLNGEEIIIKQDLEDGKFIIPDKFKNSHTQLKPAHEPIVLAQKPREGTYCENIEKYGCGGINIDDCRVSPTGENLDGGATSGSVLDIDGYDREWMHDKDKMEQFKNKMKEKVQHATNKGRFPANLLLTHHPDCEYKGEKKVKGGNDPRTSTGGVKRSGNVNFGSNVDKDNKNCGYADKNGKETVEDWDCHPDCPIRRLDEQSGVSISSKGRKDKLSHASDKIQQLSNRNGYRKNAGYNDKSEASRYFNNFSWQDEDFFKYTAKASKKERTMDGEVDNLIPTVKPIELMRWLVRLVTPEDGVVLDPFMGSGTTLLACMLEDKNYIGMDKNEHHYEITKERIKNIDKLEE
ncbi:MAG: DNA methyltransferase [Halanaerobiales bacterium]